MFGTTHERAEMKSRKTPPNDGQAVFVPLHSKASLRSTNAAVPGSAAFVHRQGEHWMGAADAPGVRYLEGDSNDRRLQVGQPAGLGQPGLLGRVREVWRHEFLGGAAQEDEPAGRLGVLVPASTE